MVSLLVRLKSYARSLGVELFGGRGQWVPVGVSDPETEVAVITLHAAIGFDLEQPAKNELEPASRAGSCNLRAPTLWASEVGRTGKDVPHKSPCEGRLID